MDDNPIQNVDVVSTHEELINMQGCGSLPVRECFEEVAPDVREPETTELP
tara:strand:- start:1325 stop:1474 length:150 start_codon:yes stop_codon:yes gene_type:complete